MQGQAAYRHFPVKFVLNKYRTFLKYSEVINSMLGLNPWDCDITIEFDLRVEDYLSTGECKCPWSRTNPPCKPCQRGRSFRTRPEAEAIIRCIKERSTQAFQTMLDNIKQLFLNCRRFAFFFQSSIVVINLQNRYFQGQKISLSFDLGRIFERIMTSYERNSLLQAGQRCELSQSGIYQHVRMPISSRSIFPDFADISIRNELLALSMSMKMLCRLVPLHRLHENVRIQMQFMRYIAQHICRMFIRKQMLKCM